MRCSRACTRCRSSSTLRTSGAACDASDVPTTGRSTRTEERSRSPNPHPRPLPAPLPETTTHGYFIFTCHVHTQVSCSKVKIKSKETRKYTQYALSKHTRIIGVKAYIYRDRSVAGEGWIWMEMEMPDLDGLAPPPQPLHASRKSPTGYFGLLYKGMLQARVVLKAGAFFFP